MDQLHQKLMDKKGWYHFWHSQRGHQVAHWAVFLFVALFMTAAIYARINDVGIIAQLRGMFGFASEIVVTPSSNLQTVINSAQCGDVIVLQAGATWDTANPYQLPNKGCSAGNPITIRSSQSNLLPSGRVSPADAPNMARIRTSNGSGAFQSTTNAGFWIFDGLEVTDIASGNTVVNFFFDFASFRGAHDMTIQRSYIHPKEIGTTIYNRAAMRAVDFEGSGLLFKGNYAAGFLGRQPDGQLPNTQVVLCISCNNVTLSDNFIQAWYTAFFTGGGGSEPQYTATLSNASTTSATFSGTPGLSAGTLVRFNLTGTATSDGSLSPYNDVVGTFNSSVITRTGGETLVNFDAAGSQQGYHIRFTPTSGGTTYRGRLKAVSGNSMRVVWEYGASAPAGSYNWTMWAVAKVDNVSGGAVNYTPYGPNRLLQSPSMPGQAAWRDSAVVHDWKVVGNTIDIPYDYSVYEHNANGNSPKGIFELKDMDTMLFEGNLITGYPSTLGLSNRSNEGGTPWSTMRNLTFRSNFFNYTLTEPSPIRQLMIAQTDDYSNSATPGANISITNNLAKGVNVVAQSDAMVNATITHNTLLNDNVNALGNSVLFGISASPTTVFKDNIVAHNSYGLNCQVPPNTRDICWPSGVFQNNVVVDNRSASVNVNSWGTGSILGPIPTSFSQVGFTNLANNDFRLIAGSLYKGKASDGTDPGVNWTTLVSALGFDPTGAPSGDINPTDTTPPSTALTNPTSGTTVSGTISVAANASDNTGVSRVEFLRDGSVFATDTSSPYSASLDTTTVTNGSHNLQSRAYDGAGNNASSGNVSVTVSNTTTPPITTQKVVSLTLVNADTDQDIATLNSGDTINLANGRNLNVRANTDPVTVGSVRFELDTNTNFRTENDAPYALAGDTNKDYNPWTPSVGDHTIKATPYSSANADGTAGTVWSVSFKVIDQTPITSKPHLSLSPTSVSFSALATDPAPAPKTVTLSNTGSGTSSWSVQSNQDWCFVNSQALQPVTGTTSAGGQSTLSISVGDPDPGHIGTFSCSISISDANADNSPQAISVTYAVTTPDPAPVTPSITSFSVSSKSATTATITWTTNQATTGTVKYGINKNNLNLSSQDTVSKTTHSVNLFGLSPKATYYYQITATNQNGSTSSIISSFRTKPK